jgi:hypothetical protein
MKCGFLRERGNMNMRKGRVFFGMAMTVIFGGGFLIRLIRDGDFYIAEFVGGTIGISVLLISIVTISRNKSFGA